MPDDRRPLTNTAAATRLRTLLHQLTHKATPPDAARTTPDDDDRNTQVIP